MLLYSHTQSVNSKPSVLIVIIMIFHAGEDCHNTFE